MPDVAVLGIKVDNGEVVKAITSLDGLTVAGTKAEASASRLSRRMGLAEIAAREMDAEMGKNGRTMALLQIEAQKMDAEYGQMSRQMGLLEIEARKMDAAMSATTKSIEHGTEAHEQHIHGLSRIGTALATMVGHATGVPPVLERIGDALAITAFGHLATVGVLAGFAAIAFAYEKITEKAREAAKEIEKTRGVIAEAANAGKTDPIREVARKLQFGEPFDKEHKLVPVSEFAPGAFEGSLLDLQGRLRSLQTQFYATTNGFTQLQIQKQIVGVQESLKPMEKLMADMQAAAANVATQPGENAGRLGGVTVEALSESAIRKAATQAEREAAREAAREAKEAQEIEDRQANARNQLAINEINKRAAARAKAEKAAQKEIDDANEAGAKAIGDEVIEALRKQKAQEKYVDDIRKIWLHGIDRIVTDGLRSFRGFFEEVLSMFTRLMARMEAEGKDGGFAYKALDVGASAIAGGMAGFGLGQSLYSSSHGGAGNTARGAIGGAAAGALAGTAILPGIGTAVGAMAGFVGGILGVGSAAKEAARQMAEAVKAVTLSIDALRATAHGDVLGQGLAAIEADRAAQIKAVEEAWSGGGAGSDRVLWRTAREKEINALEDERIAKLKEEYALSQTYAREDLEVRKLRAEGHAKEADAMARQEAADREIAQAIADHRSDEYLATLRYVTGLELATNAMDKATSSALNMVEGYKLQAQVYRVMASGPQTQSVGGAYAGASYSGPIRAPSGPARGTPQPTEPVTLQPIVLTVDGRVLAEATLRQFGARQTGGNLKVAFGDLAAGAIPQ